MIQKHRCSQQSGFAPRVHAQKTQKIMQCTEENGGLFSENWAMSPVAFSSENWAVSPVAFSLENWAVSPVSFSSENWAVPPVSFSSENWAMPPVSFSSENWAVSPVSFSSENWAVSPRFLLWTEGRVVCAQRSFQVWCQHCRKPGLCAHTAATTVDFLTESDALTHCVHHALLFPTSSTFHK